LKFDGSTGGTGGTGGTGASGGSGGTGGSGGDVGDAGPDGPPPRCARIGAEQRITNTAGGTGVFSLLWDTDHYILVFKDETASGGDIMVLGLDQTGMPVGPPTPVEATPAPSALPALVKTPTGYVVAWQEGTVPQLVHVHALDGRGAPRGGGVDVASSMADAARPTVAQAPGGTAIAWMDVTSGVQSVFTALLDANLQVVLSAGVRRIGSSTDAAAFPSLVGDGTTTAILWSDQRTGVFDIRFEKLGAQLQPQGAETVLRDATNDAQLGRMIQTSFGYLAAWEDGRSGNTNEIYAAITNASGVRQLETLVEEPGTGDANWPNMAWNGTAAGIVYYQFRGGSPQIFISFVDASGQRVGNGSDLQVSDTPGGARARFPDIEWTGTEFGVAWIDTRETSPQVYFARVNCQ
jgi:hypothetical protein